MIQNVRLKICPPRNVFKFHFALGMRRIVIINSYEKIHEGLVRRGHDIAGRPHDDIPTRVQTNDFRSIGGLDYSKEWAFIRKLTYGILIIVITI